MFKKLLALVTGGNGSSDDVDLPQDLDALAKQAESGNADAQCAMGRQHYQGYGHPENDYTKAIYWFTKAAEQNHSEALYYCGQMYDTGRGVEKDSTHAFVLLSKAAHLGHAGAQFDVGIMYKNGEGGVGRNNEKAIEWFKKAAAQGHKQAKKWLEYVAKK